jgi:hypothetical protein
LTEIRNLKLEREKAADLAMTVAKDPITSGTVLGRW